ncbi:hypothetical protein [Gillisia sp. Hel_I_29]|uniref:hypothetical protein n=1 Tax=Gillisia sp. Hel_I_29 TaxID=1249975 RepID=UPI00054F0423|nr:hypothetical protein [Gillisia sp. Hel_I_29]
MKENLLPNYYKKIGLTFGLLSLIFLILNLYYPDLINSNKELIKWICKDIFLTSLLLLVFTKEKVETDVIKKIRSERLKQSLIFGAAVLILDSISELSFNIGDIEMKSGYEIMIMILLFYLITFSYKKKYNYNKASA